MDPLLVELLEVMRTPGGKHLSKNAWAALEATVLRPRDPDDHRVREARGWWECAYEWRIVSYATHAHESLNAKAAGRLLFYIPSIDSSSNRLSRDDFEDMPSNASIGKSAQLPGILPVYVGMDMIPIDPFLPPR